MDIPTKSHAPTPEHEAFLAELKSTLGSTGKNLQADVLLAISAQFVGMLIAMQDQRRFTPQMAMEIVARNIEVGNATAIEANLGRPGGAA